MSSKAGGRKKNSAGDGTITENRRARRDFEVTETFEAGLVLQGTEVKSLRLGKANLAHSFATVREGEGFLMNADIPEYVAGNRHNHKATQAAQATDAQARIEQADGGGAARRHDHCAAQAVFQ